jgi:hypothetical protein
MATLIWILIAIALVAGLVSFNRRRARNSMNDPEIRQGTARGTDQIADAGSDSQDYASSSVLRPLPGTQTGERDPALHAATALGSDSGTAGPAFAQLLETHESQRIIGQWKEIQTEFVDAPRKAVQDADALVAELMQRLAEPFAREREQLESQWAGGDDVSTEDLRRCVRRYRSFFDQPYAQLLETHEMQRIRGEWREIQAEFVDEPRKAVQEADALVAELTQRLAQTSASEREQLEARWAGGDDVSTEDLRQALRLYRSFFDRLLAG